MATRETNMPPVSKATQPLQELREILQEARSADDAERIHAVLVEVVDGLIGHAQRQARAIDDLRSDMGHKQGIVSKINEREQGSDTPVAVQNDNDRGDL